MRSLIGLTSALIFTAGLLAAPSGCGDTPVSVDNEVCDNNKDDDNNGLTDCADSACTSHASCKSLPDLGVVPDGNQPDDDSMMPPTPDAGIDSAMPEPDAYKPPAPDASTQPSAMETVVSEVMLPTNANDYATDLDGTGKKNKLGEIISALTIANMDMQAEINTALNTGQFLLLLEVLAPGIINEMNVDIQGYLGEDLDGDATDNFDGLEQFGISASTPAGLKLTGAINSSHLFAEGTLLVPLPLTAGPPAILTLKKAIIESDLSGTGMTNGIIAGAIPIAEVNSVLLPQLGQMLTDMLDNPNIDATMKAIVQNLFDTNKDGVITAAEIQGNFLLSQLLKPDVDTDGDGTPDALSVGIGFKAVLCTIKKLP
jgi:hypothetical protein